MNLAVVSMDRFERYREKHKHPCADCSALASKDSKRCKACDRKWRQREMSENPVRLRHGLSKSPEHYIWTSMIQRCTNPKAQQYNCYGGRGIRVCERWLVFDNFIADMGPRPNGSYPSGRALYSIEREDTDGDYTPENCRWATQPEQMRNIRNQRMVAYLGETLPLVVLVERLGLSYKIVHQRLSRGWSIEEAIDGKNRTDEALS
jgi:hypothetical protein